ncbi:MAG: hypothetical protein WCV69_03575 [Patescibacteria group bacterium]|jgi:hypothetical protein
MDAEKMTPLLPVNELFISSWAMYKEKIKTIIRMALLGLLPSLLVAILLAIIAVIFRNDPNFTVINTLLALLMAIPLLYISFRINIAVYLMVSKDITSVKDVWRSAGKYFWNYSLTLFWAGLMLMLWLILLVVPGFIFLIFYSLVMWVFFLENYHGYTAVKRSKELVTGYWSAVALRLLALFVPLFLFSLLMSIIKNQALQDFVSSIFDFFFGIFIIIYTYQLYNNLLKIKGHSKLEHKGYKPWVYVAIILAYAILFIGLYLYVVFSPGAIL